jgi:hypothetical protein
MRPPPMGQPLMAAAARKQAPVERALHRRWCAFNWEMVRIQQAVVAWSLGMRTAGASGCATCTAGGPLCGRVAG